MPQTLYYAQLDNEYFGPFALEIIAGMHLTPDVLVLSTETNEWKEAAEYAELIDSLDLSLFVTNDDSSSDEGQQNSGHNYTPPTFNERSIFYVRREGNPYGPYTLEALASVTVNEMTEVSLDGMMTWHKIADILGLLNTLAAISLMGSSEQEDDAQSSSQDQGEELSDLLNRIKGLTPNKNRLYKRVFTSKEAERDFLIAEYNRLFDTLLNLIKSVSEICEIANLSRRAIALVTDTINSTTNAINSHYSDEIERIKSDKVDYTTSCIAIGQTDFSYLTPLEDLEIARIDFLTILGDKNLCVTYDAASESKANDFVNSIIARLYESNPARLITTVVVDADFMTGLDDSFKLLNRDLYKVVSRADEVRNAIQSLRDRASSILRNLLVEKGATLQSYNSTHESKEANVLLVVKDFPHGLNADTMENLWRLVNAGPKVGIYVIILTSKDSIYNLSQKEAETFDWEKFKELSTVYNFENNTGDVFDVLRSNTSDTIIEKAQHFVSVSESEIKNIVKALNSKCELNEDVVVSFADYMPDRSDWWSFDSAKQIEIPFGVGNDMLTKSLKITQESGQNTAVVIGIPGSGKSVFLHSLICSSAIKYSPDELRMYLIDFSGVEFNSYALGKLPHARVIAPEAEREFGLSILNELVEEGARRMTLCRDHNVSNIVDLKRVAPDINVSRLLVIIDEFQKLFEIENDLISREANSKIHIIIQEFRKFGINLILATQKLPSGSFLPRDLIANRIVFKSSPADFAALISTEGNNGMPRLRTGQCIYNSESGAAYDNEKVQGYYVSKTDIDSLLQQLSDFEKSQKYEREPLKVFRSAEQPDFKNRRLQNNHMGIRKAGSSIPVYLGESISVSDYDVNLELNLEGANHLLIIGGEAAVAESICFHSLVSVSTYHADDSASFIVINGMRSDNPMANKIMATINSLPFGVSFPTKSADIEYALTQVKELIEERKESSDSTFDYVYLGIFDFQNCHAFDKDTSGKYEKPSTSATLLEYILRNGSSVGVFTILQVDSLENLTRIGSVLNAFNYRIALQMPEMDSTKIVGSSAANKLFVFNRPAAKYRGYLRDNNRNLLIKFKPYKFS